MPPKKIKIAFIAGEDSGDLLGAHLIEDIKKINPEIEFIGVGGDKMVDKGMFLIESNQAFAIMGFSEVLKNLIKLLRLRKKIVKAILLEKPDLFIGIDAPDLNFPIEKKLKKHDIPIIHYVSPSIWAWREKRAVWISLVTDLVLTLFPFEPKYYQKHGGRAEFVGHPLAESIEINVDKNLAKKNLAIDVNKRVLALLPGSRSGELKRHTEIFIQTALELQEADPSLHFISANTTKQKRNYIESIAKKYNLELKVYKNATDVLKAADQALLASGTVALEAMLCKTPMVISYKISNLTYFIVKFFKMLKLPYYSLPNVLYGDFLVPEVLQKNMTVENLVTELQKQNQPGIIKELKQQFTRLHQELISTDLNAAQCVINLLKINE
jgi:lipid-A-disaccharide synthase